MNSHSMELAVLTGASKTGKISPQELTESRLQLHYAVQYIAATGAALAEPLPDDSHTSFVWNPVLEVFVGSIFLHSALNASITLLNTEYVMRQSI